MPALCIFFLGAGVQSIFVVAIALAAYLSILLIHELGHHYAAVRRGYHVDRIEVFPLHAVCRFEHPDHAADLAVIAWGGPLAQFVSCIPFLGYLAFFGYTKFQAINAVLAILGAFNPLIGLLNLAPIAPLDGKAAWSLIPLFFSRGRRTSKPGKTALQAFEDALKKAQKR